MKPNGTTATPLRKSAMALVLSHVPHRQGLMKMQLTPAAIDKTSMMLPSTSSIRQYEPL
jgi:hypothetical protein